MGVRPIASSDVVVYPVSLVSATGGRDIYAELNACSIGIPPPPTIPPEATEWIGLQYLESCWMEAVKWLNVTAEKRKHGPQAWRSFLKKETSREAMLNAVEALHELREKGSDLSPPLWCWWRISQLLEKGDPPFFFHSVWPAAALKSPKMRRWYYEEVAADILCRKKLWPHQAREAYALVRRFLDHASALDSAEGQRKLWDRMYGAEFDRLLQTASFVKVAADNRLSDRAKKGDLGVWLSSDIVVYLKLADVAVSMTDTKSPLTTTVRRRKLKPEG